MRGMVKLLHDKMLKYNWVGFYLLEPGALPPVLVLGAFEGAMTPHTRIPLNQGICGAAASSGQDRCGGRCRQRSSLPRLLARNQV